MMIRTGTVFIVDDDDSARIGLSRLLRVAGYNVQLYADASAFLAEVCETPNACILLDMRLPGQTGINLQAELASKGIFMPVIIVTADEDPDTRQQAKQAGVVAFFRKPVDGAALLDAIAWAISNREK